MNLAPTLSTAAAACLSPGARSMTVLNSECFCISLDTLLLRHALESEIGEPGLFDLIQQRCPYLFATRPVFLSREHAVRVTQVVQAIESVVALPYWPNMCCPNSPQRATGRSTTTVPPRR